jgi:hypothetical protein
MSQSIDQSEVHDMAYQWGTTYSASIVMGSVDYPLTTLIATDSMSRQKQSKHFAGKKGR